MSIRTGYNIITIFPVTAVHRLCVHNIVIGINPITILYLTNKIRLVQHFVCLFGYLFSYIIDE